MRISKALLIVGLLIALLISAMSAAAALAASFDSLVVDTQACTLTVTFTVEDAGDYYVEIWDDGTQEAIAGGPTAAGATVTYVFTIGPVGSAAAGIGVLLTDSAATIYDVEDPYSPGFGECSGASWDPIGTTTVSADCPNPVPADFVVRSIPAGALAYFEPSEGAYTGFDLPAGQTWYTGVAEGGFVEVWIACQATNVFVPAGNVVG